ncbi:MAG TPA: permease-like cell division protein FtsX, partial [Saprospiraceae bacterium]|nr:permease-like cell division protein FtsX [Saprospiraceae bacterium]
MKSFAFSYTPYYWLTVTSLAVLLLFGGLFVSSFWFSERWEEMFKENIEFLVECDPDLKEAQLIEIENKLSKIDGVRDLSFVTAADAMKLMKKELGDIALPDSTANPFSPSFRFKLVSAQVDTIYVKTIEKEILQIEGVNAFYYPEDLYSSVRARLKSISLLIGAIGGVLLLLILVMIHHQIRMYIMQHRFHIRTMSLVGATRGYIRKPFIMEVMKMSSFAILVAGICYFLVLLWIGNVTDHSLFVNSLDMVVLGMLFIIALGILMSFSAAWAAIQRYLEST